MFQNKAFSQEFIGIPFIKNYDPKEYQAGMQNGRITQDRRGVIYIANNYGLLEFDGNSWRVYAVSNGTKVRSVGVNSSGSIFVGAQNQFGYYLPEANGTLTYHSLSDSLPVDEQNVGEVWNTFILNDRVYFQTLEHIYAYNGQVVNIIATGDILSTYLVNNQLFVQLQNEGIQRLENDKLIPIRGGKSLNYPISGIVPLMKDKLLVATLENGLFIYDGTHFNPWLAASNEVLSEAIINTILRMSNDEVAIGTENEGLYILTLNGQIKYHLNKERGLNHRTVLSLMEDRYGNLWVGQNNGLAKVEASSPFTYINEQSGVQGAGYSSYLNGDELILGTNNGIFRSKGTSDKDLLVKYEFVPQSQGQVYSIDKIDDKILVGHHRGALEYDDGKIMKFSNHVGAWKFYIPRKHPDLLVEGNYDGFNFYNRTGEKWDSGGQLKGLLESSRVFEEESDGTIWMTHGYKGAYRLKLSEDAKSFSSVQFYDENDGFATNRLINVFRVNNELIFCTGEGVYRYNRSEDKFELHPKFTEILGPGVHIREVEEDPYGNVYFISSGFSGVLIKDTFGNYKLEKRQFNRIHNRLNDDLEDITVIDRNNVLFGAQEGFIHYDSKKKSQLFDSINVLIRQVKSTNNDTLIFDGSFISDGKVTTSQPTNANVLLEFENNSIQFEFASPFSDSESKTQYSYLLKGFDTRWSGWIASNSKEYTNLREGKYTFYVKAKNIYDVESREASFSFVILAPWYRTSLAYFAYFILFFFIIGGLLLTQNLRHKREKKVMTIYQQKELIKKDNQMVEITEKSKAEIVRLKNEKLELEINSKNKELASTTMNLIDKNQLLTGLKSDISSILNQTNKAPSEKAFKDMIKKIDKNIGHDDEWEHFQQYFDQVHGDFTNRLREEYENLSPQEVKLSNYLRMNLSTKEIAQLMNITIRGVEIARYRLRKKLNLEREINLTEFIGRF